jgi:hypothetical protein
MLPSKIRKSKIKNCLLVFFVLLAGVCSAQSRIELAGKVTDSTAAALPMANVQLITGKDTLIRYTGPDGVFSFQLAPSSQALLITSHVGFETDYKYLDIASNLSVHITLVPASVQLGEAVVTARSKALVNHSEHGAVNLNSRKLSQIPAVLGVPDMIRVLQLMPGVQNSGEANGYLYVRGADPGHNLMLYNDVPVYGMSHLLGIFPFYNTDHIDRIHFDKPGSEARYGNRLGATVQALSPDQMPSRFTVRGNVGLVASQVTVGSPLGEKAGLVLSGRQTYIDQIITPILNTSASDKAIDDLGYSFTDANLTLMLRPGRNHRVNINAFASGDRFRITDDRMLLDGTMKWDNYTASATWDWKLHQEIKLGQEIYFSRYTNRLQVQQASVGVQVQSEVLDWGFRSNAGFRIGMVPFTAGIHYANYHVRPQEFSSSQLSNIAGTDNTIDAQYLAVYLQGKPQFGDYLSLDVGLRACFYTGSGSNRRTDYRLEPRVSLNFTDGYKWNAHLTYARKSQHLHLITTSSVGFPTDFWIATSEGIPVELADNFSIGSGYKVFPRMELTAGVFYSRLSNLVQYPFSILQFNEITSFSNDLFAGKGKAYGAELMLRKTGRLSGWVSYTWSKSDRQFDKIDNGQSFPSKFDRRHNLSLVVHYEISKRWSAGLTQVYTSGNRFTAPVSWYFINNNPVKEYGRYNNAQMPHYKRTDVSVDYYLKKTSRRESVLNFSVYNLFAIDNPIYVVLDISSSETGNKVTVHPRYKSMYSILPSIAWRFKF